jgi:DNA-directed RNA polymerase subunit H (RpoH/RPB5)
MDPIVASTIVAMLTDRGYDVFPQEIKNEVICRSSSSLLEPIMLFAFDENQEKVNAKTITHVVKAMELKTVKRSIVASALEIPYQTVSRINEIKDRNKVELFLFSELQFPIVRHVMVPQHVKLSADDAREVIATYAPGQEGMLHHVLPNISVADTVSRYYAFERGDIILIKRKVGPPYYRIVV